MAGSEQGSAPSIDVTAPSMRRAWARASAQAWTDDGYRARLIADPVGVLREEGAEIAPGAQVAIDETPLAALGADALRGVDVVQAAGAGTTGGGSFGAAAACVCGAVSTRCASFAAAVCGCGGACVGFGSRRPDGHRDRRGRLRLRRRLRRFGSRRPDGHRDRRGRLRLRRRLRRVGERGRLRWRIAGRRLRCLRDRDQHVHPEQPKLHHHDSR